MNDDKARKKKKKRKDKNRAALVKLMSFMFE